MSLIDAFGEDIRCPACGSAGAKKLLFFVSCPNRSCVHGGGTVARQTPSRPQEFREKDPDFDPAAATLQIRYKNFENQDKTFNGDPATLRVRGAHVSLRVSPSGQRIALRKTLIANVADVDAAITKYPQPSAGDLRILKYHKRKGTSSAKYEDLRKKYPNWS